MSRPPTSTRLSALREAAGLTLLDAARHAGVTPEYLRRIERQGQAPFVLAQKLARRYGCSSMIFAHKISAGTTSPQKGDRATSKKRGTQSRQGARAKVPCLASDTALAPATAIQASVATTPASVTTIHASAASAGTAATEEGLQA